MKKILSLLVILSTATLFSCKKKEVTTFPLAGLWSGTVTTNATSYQASFIFKTDAGATAVADIVFPDGTERAQFGSYTNTNGLIVITQKFNYPAVNTTYHYKCTYSSNSNTMTGTYGDGVDGSGQTRYDNDGTFTLTRQ